MDSLRQSYWQDRCITLLLLLVIGGLGLFASSESIADPVELTGKTMYSPSNTYPGDYLIVKEKNYPYQWEISCYIESGVRRRYIEAWNIPSQDGTPYTATWKFKGDSETVTHHWTFQIAVCNGEAIIKMGDTGFVGGTNTMLQCQDIEFEPPSVPSPQSLTDDPIDVTSGAMVHSMVDIAIAAPGPDIVLDRGFSSKASVRTTGFGGRWNSGYDVSPSVHPDATNTPSYSTVRLSEGVAYATNDYYYPQVYWHYVSFENTIWFPVGGYGAGTNSTAATSYLYRAESEDNTLLRINSSNSIKSLDYGGGLIHAFNTNQQLSTVSDGWGNTQTMNYDTNGLLTNIQHSAGQYLNFFYTTNYLVKRVETPSTNLTVYYYYDSNSDLTNRTISTGGSNIVTVYKYNSDHCITQIIDQAGNTYDYGYTTNSEGEYVVANAMDLNDYHMEHSVTYTTNRQSTLTEERDATNEVYKYFYQKRTGKLTKVEGPFGTNYVTTWTRDRFGAPKKTVTTDHSTGYYQESRRAYYQNEYDAPHPTFHHFTNFSYAYNDGATSRYTKLEWDVTNQLLTALVDPLGVREEYEYTNGSISVERVIGGSITNETSYFYKTNGLLDSVTNANGNRISFVYDANNFLESIIPEIGPYGSNKYSNLGVLESVTYPGDGGDRVVTLSSDEIGRTTNVSYPNGATEQLVLNNAGRVLKSIDTISRTNEFFYDSSFVTQIVRHVGSGKAYTNSMSFDQQFNLKSLTDAEGRPVESYERDLLSRITTVTNIEGQTASVTYQVGSYVDVATRYDGTTVSNLYNSMGLLETLVYGGMTNSYTYLDNGLLKTATGEAGTTSNSYDAINRLTNVTQALTGEDVSYGYYPAGNLSNVVSLVGEFSYAYDAAERLTTLTAPEGAYTVTYNTNLGSVAKVTYPSGIFVEYDYDVMIRVTNAVWYDASTNVIRRFAYQYTTHGLVTNVTFQDSTSLAYDYDGIDQLTSFKRLDSAGATISSEAFTYDRAFNRLTKNVNGTIVTYTYPGGTNGNRLTEWNVTTLGSASARLTVSGNSSEPIHAAGQFGNLGVSNIASVVPDVDTTNFVAKSMSFSDGTNVVVATIPDAAGNDGLATNSVVITTVTNAVYESDIAGNITNIAYVGHISYELVWDGGYNLKTVRANGSVVGSYVYDPYGQLVSISDGQSTNRLVFDGDNVIAEVNTSGDLLKSYTYGGGVDELLSITTHGTSTSTYYYISDHIGSITALIDTNGVVVEQYEYDAFGRPSIMDGAGAPLSVSAIGNPYLFQSRRYVPETGLYYFRARWYDPKTGRWISKDKAGLTGGLNLYAAFHNNPVGVIDPYGASGHTTADEAMLAYNSISTPGRVAKVAKDAGGVALRVDSGVGLVRAGVDAVQTSIDPCASNGEKGGAWARLLFDLVTRGKGQKAKASLGMADDMTGPVKRGWQSSKKIPKAPKATATAERAKNLEKGIPPNQLGPSGKPKIHTVDHSSRKKAKDAARRDGKTGPIKNPSDEGQPPHFHAADKYGKKIGKQSPHHNYPPSQR